jgi:large subunit ribosomal protein L7/L12
MPELKNIGSSEAAASSDNTTVAQQVTPEAAVDAADTFEVDAAPSASTAVGDLASLSPNSAEALVTGVATSDSTAACALPADKSTFNVILKAKGASPYQVIKEIRAITGLGLKEAQALVDNLPNVIKEGASWDEAKDIETHLKAAGGDVDVE